MFDSIYLEQSEFQQDIVDYLVQKNDYIERKNTNYNRNYAIDEELLFRFLDTTQPDEMQALRKIFKEDTEDVIVNYINNELTKQRGSLVSTLKNGLVINNINLELMYTKPATEYNKELLEKYNQNIFSVIQEVQASDNERVDLVIFLNGFAIISIELKSNASGQSYRDAIEQYRLDRNPKTRLFIWKAGCLVNFAMDLEEVYMTTKLDKESTFFMPFNQGKGEGIETGAGNPIHEDKLSVYYMWEDILTKDTILELISKFIYIETKEEKDNVTEKTKIKETVIFPRYHQLDLIRSLLADVKEHGSSQNYLIEHSAGSGKTNSIAWMAHRLTSLHNTNNEVIFDNIIVVTDRVIVDRQLQRAIMALDHQPGLINVMDDDCTSQDLKNSLMSNTKITVTTIQKFPYIVSEVSNLKDKKFAVIIDEAHSSTAGKNMRALMDSLGSDENDYVDAQDMIAGELQKTGKQDNVSMFAFTATPKPTTLRMFGKLNKHGQYAPFHLYSMKQAIEEGYILDVLQNYTTYETMYRINKEMEEDPRISTSSAKKQIARFVELHDTNISQRIEVIVEHFRQNVMDGLGGQAKAMIVTSSRQAAVKYKKALDKYIRDNNYMDISALVAFSGKVHLEEDDANYTEVSMNRMREDHVPYAFDTDNYNVMIVANKYQTGFDQKKLCAMYIMKKLRDVNAVQTLSRLNRICPPYDKKIFVLDFTNDYEDIKKAFSRYYTTTLLANDLTPGHIYDIQASVDAFGVIDPLAIDIVYELIFKKRTKTISKKEQNALIFHLQRSARLIKEYSIEDQEEIAQTMRSFVRFYEYLIQVSPIEDQELHKKYTYVSYLLDYISIDSGGDGFDLKGKIQASNFAQVKKENHGGEKQIAKPVVKLPTADAINMVDDKRQRLSEIIAEINAQTGKDFDVDSASSITMQIIDRLLETEKVKTSAKNNTQQDFGLSFSRFAEDAITDSFTSNEDFFTLLLNNEEARNSIIGMFIPEIYTALRKKEETDLI